MCCVGEESNGAEKEAVCSKVGEMVGWTCCGMRSYRGGRVAYTCFYSVVITKMREASCRLAIWWPVDGISNLKSSMSANLQTGDLLQVSR